jgi:hypothetical protein
MAKTEQTLELERKIYFATQSQGCFGCHEVTIGWFGDERVDYLTFDTDGIWRCYEIKVSKSDFHSKAKNTFVGHFNYYVMPDELYEEVKDEIPAEIGVHNGGHVIKKPKKQSLGVSEDVLLRSFARSLTRAYRDKMLAEDPSALAKALKRCKQTEKDRDDYKNRYYDAAREIGDHNRFLRKLGLRDEYDKYKDEIESKPFDLLL